VHLDDVLVVDPVRGARFTQEALSRRRVARQLGREELDGDVAPDDLVACAVDRAHAAGADLLEHVVASADVSADERVGQVDEGPAVERTRPGRPLEPGAADLADPHVRTPVTRGG
jgi:hypothetical protein